ncbi:alpha/beta fold hydrolase [Thioclava sp. 15-R06ZXC-3]|uniref:Alpha/beta fold hydrolase n=1 Tax=Thioclava arctica TaxID=3238301 RepID=A0ABV3TGP6_9RHOB
MTAAETEKQNRAEAWRETLLAAAREKGFFEDVGDMHKAIFIPAEGAAAKTLVVVFDNLDDVRQKTDRLPWAVDFISSQGWSSLGFMAHGPTWYRDDAVLDYFDRLQAQGFFKKFKRVVFYGTSMGGYAACAFSAAVPGATVVAINPQSTLAREDAAWEHRFRPVWHRNFSGRYGFAPDMVANAKKVWLFYDSRIAGDAAHVALFSGAQIEKIKCPFMGHGMLSVWRDMGILKPIVSSCIEGRATRESIAQLMRNRHSSLAYKRAVLSYLQKKGRHVWVVRWADAVMRERRGPVFVKARSEALAALGPRAIRLIKS